MKTPAGTECPYYYADFHRGRDKQECRLVARNPKSKRWTPSLCQTCPVPKIARANACEHLVLSGAVTDKWLGMSRQVEVTAYCKKTVQGVKEPEIGCGHCHEAPDAFDKL